MIKILLADDHALLRDGLRRSFEAAGDTVVGEASTGEEAVALAKALMPQVTSHALWDSLGLPGTNLRAL